MRRLLEAHGIRPLKRLGQNFVIDPNTIRKVVSASGAGPGDAVLEVGAGVGSLTLGLVAAARHVTAIEVDPRLAPILAETVGAIPNCDLLFVDVLTTDLGALPADAVVANLPYNVAVPVIFKVLEEAPAVRRITVMTQREVGERLAAAPGSKVYGRTSVMTWLHAEATVVAPVSRRAFYPVPNVDSVIVRLERVDRPITVPVELVRDVVRHAFAQRRKTMRNSLSSLAGGLAAADALLRRAEVPPGARPESLEPARFVRVAEELARGPALPQTTG